MRKIFLLIVLFLISSSCKDNFTSPELKNHFSEKEIDDLEKIVSFYTNQLSKNGSENFEDIFNTTLIEFMDSTSKDNFYSLDFNKQKKLYRSISDDTFNKIWIFNKRFNYNDRSTAFKNIGFKHDSKYNQFLREVSLKNDFIKEYTHLLEGTGSFEQLNILTYLIIENKDKFDLNDPNIQLIIAIDNLSNNDSNNRKELFD